MTAMVGGKGQCGFPAGLFRKFCQSRIFLAVVIQSRQPFRGFRSVPVHGGVKIGIVDHQQIVFVFCDQFMSLFVDFFQGGIDEIVHFPFQEDHRNTVIGSGYNGTILPRPDQTVEDRLAGQHRLFVFTDPVNLRRHPCVHGSKADRCHGRHHRTDRHRQRRKLQNRGVQIRILLPHMMGDGVRVVHNDPLRLTQTFFNVVYDLLTGGTGVCRCINTHQSGDGGTG